jgi:hypothetical protein
MNGTFEQSYNFSTLVTQSFTLYAKWLPTVLVTFESNGGSAVASQNVVVGETIIEPSAPTKSGHTFDGWYEDD